MFTIKTRVLPYARLLVFAICAGAPSAAAPQQPINNPDAIVDLSTAQGVSAVGGAWRFVEASIVGVEGEAPGVPARTHDIRPRRDDPSFETAAWESVEPTALGLRRTNGRLAFGWYRIAIRIPETIAGFSTAGSTAVLVVTADDYAEVWVDGRLPLTLGQTGGAVIAGFNAPNRVALTTDVDPGQTIDVAIFVANGPLSAPPGNFVWVRGATLDFYKPGRHASSEPAPFSVERRDAAIDSVVPQGSTLERLADGFAFTEGPVWAPARVAGAGGRPIDDGYLLFSDPNRNVIHRWDARSGVSVFREKSGYTGSDIARYRQPGSNGLAFDSDGRLTVCEHGNRRVTRIEHNGDVTVLADRFDGKRLNSPNDLVYRSDGALFFTDPFFGLPGFGDDPARELPHTGVYCLDGGELRLLSTDLAGPNGIAFSPDERFLYVTNWDERRKIVMRYECASDGALSNGVVFFDMTAAPEPEALDGVKVDRAGNLFVSGPGGVWVISPDAVHLGTIRTPELPANMAWSEDGQALYLCARTGLYRLRLGAD